jgi:hypothetical protein
VFFAVDLNPDVQADVQPATPCGCYCERAGQKAKRVRKIRQAGPQKAVTSWGFGGCVLSLRCARHQKKDLFL